MDRLLQQQIGERIRTAREAVKLRQEDVAAQMNVNRVTVTNWEMGNSTPHMTQIPQLAAILQVSILFFFEEDRPKEGKG